EGDSIPERRSREWGMGLGVAPAPRVSLRASYGERLDRRGNPGQGLVPTRAATWEAGLSARSRASLSVEMGWTRRRVADPAAAAAGGPSFWRAWGASTFLRLETLSSLALGSPRHALDPRDYLDPGATIRGNVNARQSVEYAPRGRHYDLRVEAGVRRDRTGELEN